jgi:hypothetical protein
LQVPVAAALALVAIPNNAEAATLPPNLKMVGTYTDPSHPEVCLNFLATMVAILTPVHHALLANYLAPYLNTWS